ncbi:solute carrier organic anion transporter family, member 1D1 [Alosa sapidissima]|uniref:solute carrier organic anion transporter family, member 1D1 n=1 Tax=Alosa sapidissima TaxID=34773 RepID=UPI001C09DF10|nr:solute carrier organic anion transporter family, member 1D1 [Alosa sapidissima]XP_041934962.1 solute carrier organic anion transporter family, member 1D1 [Alosa sapidissima]
MGVATKEPREPCCSKFKLFLMSMSFVYFAKAFGGSYMKSSVTQIERRFDIPSSIIGVIDGGFEVGNLLVIAFVSYFGAKMHRPRLIGAGCLIMAAGSFCTAMPHFLQGPYKYETTISQSVEVNSSQTILPCLSSAEQAKEDEPPSALNQAECEKASGSSMWIYVFMGNMLRGIGETPIMPLGVSYLDDFAREENTAFYLACIQTVGIMGPMFGYLLGSYCAKIYVDIGTVDSDTVAIDHKDSRWVGAWWMGFILTGGIMLLAGIPFWFLPKSLPKQGQKQKKTSNGVALEEQANFVPQEGNKEAAAAAKMETPFSMAAMAKDFLPSLRRLFSNSVYNLIICTSLVAVNGFIGMITFKPKFMEQTYGQSPSKAILLIGMFNLPAVALGIITGGFIMKRFKLTVIGAARISLTASFVSFCLMLSQYFMQCDNSQVAGLTINYQGLPELSYEQSSLLSQCNRGCSCSIKHWDPVCAHNGITYASPCLAGCQTSTGLGKEMIFHNCSCVLEVAMPPANMSATLGQCPRKSDCDTMFKWYMGVSVVGAFVSACGATPGYIVLLRSIAPDLKSLALGMQTLIVRTLGGIPPPIYFGALIDQTCLKWGVKRCGGQGACRIYDTDAFRSRFLGLIYGLYALSYLLWAVLYRTLVKQQRKLALRALANGQGEGQGQGANGLPKDSCPDGDQSKEELKSETSI